MECWQAKRFEEEEKSIRVKMCSANGCTYTFAHRLILNGHNIEYIHIPNAKVNCVRAALMCVMCI